MAYRVTHRVSVGSAAFLVDVERVAAEYRCQVREAPEPAPGSGPAEAPARDAPAAGAVISARVDCPGRVGFYEAGAMWLATVENGTRPGEYRVIFERRPGSGPWLVCVEDGRLQSVGLARPRVAVRAAAAVAAPMPGRLVKLLVALGDPVAQGQAIAIVEAMKMENELYAPRAGTVAELRVKEGAPIEAGVPLVVIC